MPSSRCFKSLEDRRRRWAPAEEQARLGRSRAWRRSVLTCEATSLHATPPLTWLTSATSGGVLLQSHGWRLASSPGPVVLAPGAAATGRSPVAPYPASRVDFVGFGDGFGVGMSQWGAFGYAALDHRTYHWILAHYYGGTALSFSDNVASGDPMVSVELNENDGDPVVVTSESAFSFGGIRFPGGQAVRAVESQGTWTLSEATGCSSTAWVPVASGLVESRRRAVLVAGLRHLEPGADDLRARRRRSSGSGDS